MSVQMEEKTENLARIEWKTTLNYPGRSHETITLNAFKPITQFTLCCRAHKGYANKTPEIKIHFILLEKSLKDSRNPNDKDPDPFARRKPSKGEVLVNGSGILPLTESSNYGKWISRAFTLPMSHLVIPIKLNWTIWLEFPTPTASETRCLRRYESMFSSQSDCDVQFKIGHDLIGGHTNILSAASHIFAALFKSIVKNPDKIPVISIKDVSFEVFTRLLHFVYTGRLGDVGTERKAQSLYVAADKYDLTDLKKACADFIKACIRVDNALELMSWSHRHGVNELKAILLRFIGRHSQEIYEQDEWGDFITGCPKLSLMITRHVMDLTSKMLSSVDFDYDDHENSYLFDCVLPPASQ